MENIKFKIMDTDLWVSMDGEESWQNLGRVLAPMPTIRLSEDGHWIVNDVDTDISCLGLKGDKGDDGEKGADGNISFSEFDALEDGQKENLLKALAEFLTKNETYKEALKGEQGIPGPQGEQGVKGEQGLKGGVFFEDLTPSQISQLRGPMGAPGNYNIIGVLKAKGSKEEDVEPYNNLIDNFILTFEPENGYSGSHSIVYEKDAEAGQRYIKEGLVYLEAGPLRTFVKGESSMYDGLKCTLKCYLNVIGLPTHLFYTEDPNKLPYVNSIIRSLYTESPDANSSILLSRKQENDIPLTLKIEKKIHASVQLENVVQENLASYKGIYNGYVLVTVDFICRRSAFEDMYYKGFTGYDSITVIFKQDSSKLK